jgi:hypothetical protein
VYEFENKKISKGVGPGIRKPEILLAYPMQSIASLSLVNHVL